jgi:hypothetical protein
VNSVDQDADATRVLWKKPRMESVAAFTADWEVMYSQLDSVETVLADLRRTLSHQVPDPGGRYSFTTGGAQPNFVAVREAAQVLADAMVIELHRGNPDRALANLIGLIRLAGQHAELYTLVNQMVRVAVTGLTLESTWQALQWPGWDEAQLALLQVELEQLTLLPGVLRCLEIERAMGLELFDQLQETLSGPAAAAMGSGPLSRVHLWVWRGLWSRRDLLFYLRSFQNNLEGLRELNAVGAAAIPILMRLQVEVEQAQREARHPFRYPFVMFSAIGPPNFQRALETTVRTETRRRLAVVAVALERFRCLHSSYPDQLDELVPAFLAVLPADPYTAQPLRYQGTGADQPRLWSVGADGRDHNGTAGTDEVWLLRAGPERLP